MSSWRNCKAWLRTGLKVDAWKMGQTRVFVNARASCWGRAHCTAEGWDKAASLAGHRWAYWDTREATTEDIMSFHPWQDTKGLGCFQVCFRQKTEEYLHLIASNLFSATSKWFIYKTFQTPDSIIDSIVVDCLANWASSPVARKLLQCQGGAQGVREALVDRCPSKKWIHIFERCLIDWSEINYRVESICCRRSYIDVHNLRIESSDSSQPWVWALGLCQTLAVHGDTSVQLFGFTDPSSAWKWPQSRGECSHGPLCWLGRMGRPCNGLWHPSLCSFDC